MRRGATGADEAPAPIEGVVTALLPAARRDGRVEVAVDGRPVAVLSLDAVERLGLRIGLRLDAMRGAEVAAAAGEVRTYDQAVALLAVQGRSARDLRRRLLQKGALPADADAAVAKLADGGFVDDAAYARALARSRVTGRGDPRRRVAQVLAQKGVAREVADEAVAEVFTDEAVDEGALVEAAARKKLRSLGGLDAPTRRRRLYAFLARRGHDAEAIRQVMLRVGAGELDEEGDVGGDGDEVEGSDTLVH